MLFTTDPYLSVRTLNNSLTGTRQQVSVDNDVADLDRQRDAVLAGRQERLFETAPHPDVSEVGERQVVVVA